MKKFSSFLLSVLFVTSIMSLKPAQVKADYCDDALQMCYDRCDEIYEDPYLEIACQAGCLIAYEFCGS